MSLRYARPESLAEALSLLQCYGSGARILNGGTDLMVRIQKLHVTPEVVVDIKRVADISDSIQWQEGRVIIGARAVMTSLVKDPRVARLFPALVDAASTVGSIQIRNRATLAGNICNASPAADTVPPLLVHQASVTLAGPAGTREVPLNEFFLGPGKTVRTQDELLVTIAIPLPGDRHGAAFGRLTRRHGVDLASINMACAIDSDGTVTFAFGAAAPTAVVVRDTTRVLADPATSPEARDHALVALIERTSPISDVRASAAYRTAMLLTIGRRVLAQAQERRRQH